jgi:sirohydrochlorin cobaltochelatase
MNGLLLFSHGSLLCGAGQALDEHAERLRGGGEFALVEVGYLNYSEPEFDEGVAKLIDAGATHITIVPYFLVPGYFVTVSLPQKLDGIKRAYPNVQFIIADPLGSDELLADALIESAAEAKAPGENWRDAYAAAAAECRAREDCPIFGTSYCPATGNCS